MAKLIKGFKILRIKGGESFKLQAVKTVKEYLNLGLKEALDFVNKYAGSEIGYDFEGGTRYAFETEKLSKYMDLEFEYVDEPEPYGYSPRILTDAQAEAQAEAVKWYNEQDALTRVTIDNYVSSLGMCYPACG